MVLQTQKWDKLLKIFFENPSKSNTIRNIYKLAKVPTSTVQRYFVNLKKDEIISKENKLNLTDYTKFLKTFYMINLIFRSNLIFYLEEKLLPSCIILFGSVRKGEYDLDSDIDLFIESQKTKQLDLKEFEKKLGHPIQLFIEKDINKMQTHLFNNIVNGIKLYGYFNLK